MVSQQNDFQKKFAIYFILNVYCYWNRLQNSGSKPWQSRVFLAMALVTHSLANCTSLQLTTSHCLSSHRNKVIRQDSGQMFLSTLRTVGRHSVRSYVCASARLAWNPSPTSSRVICVIPPAYLTYFFLLYFLFLLFICFSFKKKAGLQLSPDQTEARGIIYTSQEILFWSEKSLMDISWQNLARSPRKFTVLDFGLIISRHCQKGSGNRTPEAPDEFL